MVVHQIAVEYDGSSHDLEFDSEDGLEVLKFQLFSLTLVPPEKQKIMDSSNKLYRKDADLSRLSGTGKCMLTLVEEEEADGSPEMSLDHRAAIERADEELARLLQAEEEKIYLYQQSAQHGRKEFASRFEGYVSQVLQYEDPIRQEKARQTVPLDELEEKAVVALVKEGKRSLSQKEIEHRLLFELLRWFKNFFRWVNAAPCFLCGAETYSAGMSGPTSEELQYGGSRVELYRCKRCNSITRFPRYNDTLKLIETRSGRCGEWANCFTLFCRALGYQARLVLDFTDHVWTECFSDLLGRWVHMDPCETAFDKPLLYEQGWGKKLNYLIALSKDGVFDVTKRYTRNWEQVRTRRNITTEDVVVEVVSSLTARLRATFPPDYLRQLQERDIREAAELLQCQCECTAKPEVLPGRKTGTEEWRKLRGEMGQPTVSEASKNFAGPKRLCVDDHVTRILDALGDLNVFWESDSHHIFDSLLDALHQVLCNLKTAPYKMRKIELDLASEFSTVAAFFDCDMLENLWRSLALELERTSSERLCIFSNDPIETAVALPVALEILEALSDATKNKASTDTSVDRLAFLASNRRLCGGVAEASAEEEPLGIASCAFDGLKSTKWEEPNGAKGGWLTYYLLDTSRAEVTAYELVSANDCPERDPKDWVLEGSNDGGCTWSELDAQCGRLFSQRFERRFFEITAAKRKSCSALRFRCTAVRDSSSQSRLQISCIDLYERK